MMTAQEIKERVFEKAVFGGYDMGAVDDFMDEAANDFAALTKENAVLKSKMKVLVDKVEEYRSTEDAMRLALLSAQKMSVQIENEARAKADEIVAEAVKSSQLMNSQAEENAKRVLQQAKTGVATEEARIAEAKRASAKFIEGVQSMCAKQMEYLSALVEAAPVSQSAPAPAPAPATVGETRRFAAAPGSEAALEQLHFDIN